MSRPSTELNVPSSDDLVAAHERIRPHAHRTPVLTSTHFNTRCGARIFFKCENFQKIGAFKFRGACNAVFSLTQEELDRGVGAHSSGNHAQALALAARLRGTRATIVMPRDSAAVKLSAVADYGAEIVLCEPGAKARDLAIARVIEETGATLIHPFNDARIIAGQATAAKELLEEVPDLDLILAPVGGGGLLSGTTLATQTLSPSTAVMGTEPAAADDAARSLQSGSIQPAIDPPTTLADGLRTNLGELTFTMIRAGVERIVTVEEEAIVEAMREVWMRMKILIEPSAAVPVAALLSDDLDVSTRRVGVILSGGNVDLDALPW
jgi:threonine dehydratase